MKVWICVVSPDETIRDFVGKKKAGIVPSGLLQPQRFGGVSLKIKVSNFVPGGAPMAHELEAFILDQVSDLDGIIVLFDETYLHLLRNVRGSCFCVPLEVNSEGSNVQNSVHRVSARALKGWWQVRRRFFDGKDIKMLSLPLRNFQADELLELANAVRAASPELANDMQEGLKGLRARLRPRRRSPRKTLYLVDDAKRFYVYGHERHARPESGGDHHPSCELNAKFRFGCRIDDLRHYNVSESEGDKTTISGRFLNCHDVANDEKRSTHLNMFASDMYY